MSVASQAVKGGMWFVLFSSFSQVLSWWVTIFIAQLLLPADYGIMDMATVFSGYVQLFYELGLGAAIVQRERISQRELSSVFWLLLGWGSVLAIVCFFLAEPTARYYNEPQIIPITQLVAVLFILGPLFVVPRNLLHKELRFKAFGALMSISVIVSSLAMLWMASNGFGVWTLIGGHVVREVCRVILGFILSGWRPSFSFNYKEVKPLLGFGLPLAASNSFGYLSQRSDVFFGGLVFGPLLFGYYALALQLAKIPNDKLISIFNTVSYPVFSRYKSNHTEFNIFFVSVVRLFAFVVLPLYVGGVLVADDLIPLILGEKWLACIPHFKLLCFYMLVVSITAPVDFANTAQGRPSWNMRFSAAALPFMAAGFYLIAKLGDISLLALPWAVVFTSLRIGYLYITMRKIGISVKRLIGKLFCPFAAVAVMSVVVIIVQLVFRSWTLPYGRFGVIGLLSVEIIAGAMCYIAVAHTIDPKIIPAARKFIRGNKEES